MPKQNLIFYHYFEKDASYRDNLTHFLLFGILDESDYIVVISGEHTLELPPLVNVRYVFTDSKRSDFGGYAQLINEGPIISSYDFIFFVNSSVRGPFVPPYFKQSWTQILLAQMSSDVGMVGTSICTLKTDFRHSINYQERFGGSPPYSHVQTMAYVLRRSVLEAIIKSGFYGDDRDTTKTLAIEDYEIHLSQLVLTQGHNLRCLLPELNGIDYRLPHINPNPTSTVGDPNEALGYFGRSIHPYEGLFVKTNRQLFTEAYLMRLAYTMYLANAAQLSPTLLENLCIKDYVQRIKQCALQKEGVTDFSYFPGQEEERERIVFLTQEEERAQKALEDMINSTSWKITTPLRFLKDLLK
jgi:hypothetical protein